MQKGFVECCAVLRVVGQAMILRCVSTSVVRTAVKTGREMTAILARREPPPPEGHAVEDL